jgi:hypothetical protein
MGCSTDLTGFAKSFIARSKIKSARANSQKLANRCGRLCPNLAIPFDGFANLVANAVPDFLEHLKSSITQYPCAFSSKNA